MASLIRVDDANTDLLKYTGSWNPKNNLDSTKVFNGTTSGTKSNDSSITFSFNGTSVAWIGILGSTTGISTLVDVVVDGDPDTASVISARPPGASFFLQTQTLYASPPLATGAHTVVVTARNVQQDHVRFDYVEYAADDSAASASAAAPPPSAVAPPPSAVAPPPSSPAPAPPSPSVQLSDSPRRASVQLRTVVPAVLVPCVALLLLTGVFLAWRRHRRRRAPKEFDVRVNPFAAAPVSGPVMTMRGSKTAGYVEGRSRLPDGGAALPGESPPPYASSSSRVGESASAAHERSHVGKR